MGNELWRTLGVDDLDSRAGAGDKEELGWDQDMAAAALCGETKSTPAHTSLNSPLGGRQKGRTSVEHDRTRQMTVNET